MYTVPDTYLEALRAMHRVWMHSDPFLPVDPDMAAEAGMDGNYARLLQAARDLDLAAALERANIPTPASKD